MTTPLTSAAVEYARKQNEIGILLDLIHGELKIHAQQEATEPKNWGYVGSISDVRENLKRILSTFLLNRHGGKDEEAVERFIENHIAEMRKT